MTWERCPTMDEYAEDGDARRAVLVDDRVVVTSALATAILELLPADEGTVAARLVDLFGRPPDPVEDTVATALSELEAVGLIHEVPTRQ